MSSKRVYALCFQRSSEVPVTYLGLWTQVEKVKTWGWEILPQLYKLQADVVQLLGQWIYSMWWKHIYEITLKISDSRVLKK